MSQHELHVVNPFTEEVAFSLPMAGAADLDPLVARARAAFQGWKRSSVADRVALCERFVAAFEAKKEQIADEITQQMGKPHKFALGEVAGMLDRARYMISIAEQTLADEYLPEKAGFVRYIRHEPLGASCSTSPLGTIPLLIAVNVVVPAVLAGNAVIIKHSSKTPLCGRAFVGGLRRPQARPRGWCRTYHRRPRRHRPADSSTPAWTSGLVHRLGARRTGGGPAAPRAASSAWAWNWAAKTPPTSAPTRPSTSP
jgi:acyl-CoA reductase-like NAD-dependent aldehyde dehydrogenase